ncbi:LANO_0F13982g1_1 [Lachancea nothofagi CBS 11611]|uniref:intramembrane prenyl-peptidase Rce1 n=1 Tax=Lachancea nothofagi CBS 11611 TaxID=1266666 RepID=A0A1G4KC52_9SACH|nr:LANO_0F13982g1_1 [Lachancea nothofagi CBS 11611]
MGFVSIIISLYVSISYVAAIHLWSGRIGDFKIRRDDPRVIKSRVKRVIVITVINLVTVPCLISSFGIVSFKDALLSMGLLPGGYLSKGGGITMDMRAFCGDTYRALELAFILYCGPLLDNILYYLLTPGAPFSAAWYDLKSEIVTIWGFRNYFFGPLSEELFYTAMLTNVFIFTSPKSVTLNTVLWVPPLFFGLAHAHHGWEMHSLGMHAPGQILATVLIQLSYTTVFGAFTNFIFLRSGRNLWCCVILHAFANYMGLPQGSELATHFESSASPVAFRSLLGQIWKYSYVAFLVLGLVGFKNNLYNLTASKYSIEL